jgi:transcription antitermination factor NusG
MWAELARHHQEPGKIRNSECFALAKPQMDNKNWLCIQTAGGFERAANDRLQSRGIETLYPKILSKRSYFGGPPKPVTLSLYPRYLFAYCSMEDYQHAALNQRREVLSLLRFQSGPAIVSEAIISEIRSRLDENGILIVERAPELKCGSRIRITDGCFTGYEGLFQRGDETRVWALLRAIDDSTLHNRITEQVVLLPRDSVAAA